MDEDRLTPKLGRLIDAAKAAARGTAREAAPDGGGAAGQGGAAEPGRSPDVRAEGWAVLGLDGAVYPGGTVAAASAAAAAGHTEPEAAAFAVVGEAGDTLLPRAGWRAGMGDADPELPVAVKYLGRWVLVTLGEIPEEGA